MKKKKQVLLLFVIVILVGIILFIFKPWESRPYKDLTVNEISSVTISLLPPDSKTELSKTEIDKLVEILNNVVIYNKDNTYNEYNGQSVTYSILKKDGSITEINAYNPFLIINGIGYKTKYKPCQQLNSLGNNIMTNICDSSINNKSNKEDEFVLELNEPLTKNIKFGAHSDIENTEEFKTINYSPKYIHNLPCLLGTNDCINLATSLEEKDYIYKFNIPKNWTIKDNKIYSDEFDSQWMISICPVIHKSDELIVLNEDNINFTKLGKFKELLISNTYSHNRLMLGKETLIGVSFRDYEIFINCENYIIKFIAYINPKDEKYLFNFIDTFKLYYKNSEIKSELPYY